MVISNSRFTLPISFKHPWCPAAWLLKKIGKRCNAVKTSTDVVQPILPPQQTEGNNQNFTTWRPDATPAEAKKQNTLA